MKKRIVIIALVIALLATCFAGSYAYLFDTDAAVNVMTMGNVDIIQNEQERGADGALTDFTQKKPAYPAVGSIEWADETINGYQKVFHADLKNVVDKFVSVSNVGKTDAYVRTIVAIEAPDYDAKNLIHVNFNKTNGVSVSELANVDINGAKFVYAVFTYDEPLTPDNTTPFSLAQVFLDKKATNEDCAAFGDTWEILTLSQAVQSAGFENADAALDEAFEDTTAANVAAWFEAIINN